MANQIKFACTSLANSNKAGVLKPDENGYYTMIVGALNMFNSAGEYYVYEKAKELFTSSSQFMRRVQRGVLRGELGHPKMIPGMSREQFVHRILSIYEDKVCCHHKEIWLDFDNVKDANGRPVIAIMSKVLPSGPFGAALEKSLQNPNENVCFSIRAFTDDNVVRGINERTLKTVVTFDQVTEPGMSIAEKYKSPALEGLLDDSFSRGEMERAILSARTAGVAQESVVLSCEELFESLGWNVPLDAVKQLPTFARW